MRSRRMFGSTTVTAMATRIRLTSVSLGRWRMLREPHRSTRLPPTPAQPPGQNIFFAGTGVDPGGIVAWEWSSNLDGVLSTSEDFQQVVLHVDGRTAPDFFPRPR